MTTRRASARSSVLVTATSAPEPGENARSIRASMQSTRSRSPTGWSSHASQADACSPSSSGRRRKRFRRCLEWPPPASRGTAAASESMEPAHNEDLLLDHTWQQQQGNQEDGAAGQLDELLLLATVAADAAEHHGTSAVHAAVPSHGPETAQAGTSSSTTITAPLMGAAQGHMHAGASRQQMEQEELLDTMQSSLSKQQQQQQQQQQKHGTQEQQQCGRHPYNASDAGTTPAPSGPHPHPHSHWQQHPDHHQQHQREQLWQQDLEDPDVSHWGLLPQVRAACQAMYWARQGQLPAAGHPQQLRMQQQQRRQEEEEGGEQQETERRSWQDSGMRQHHLQQQQWQKVEGGCLEPCAAMTQRDQAGWEGPSPPPAAAGATPAGAGLAAADAGPSSSRRGVKRGRSTGAGTPGLTQQANGNASRKQQGSAVKTEIQGNAANAWPDSSSVAAPQLAELPRRSSGQPADGSSGQAAAVKVGCAQVVPAACKQVPAQQVAVSPFAQASTISEKQDWNHNHNHSHKHNHNNDQHHNNHPHQQQESAPQMQRQTSAGVSRLSRMTSLAAELRRQQQEASRHLATSSSSLLHDGTAFLDTGAAATAAAAAGGGGMSFGSGRALQLVGSREHQVASGPVDVGVGVGVAATARAVAAIERQQSVGGNLPRTTSHVSADATAATATAAAAALGGHTAPYVANPEWQQGRVGTTGGSQAPAAVTQVPPVMSPAAAGSLLQLKRRLQHLQLQLYRSGGGLAPAPSGGSDSGGDSQGSVPVGAQGVQQLLDAPRSLHRAAGHHQQQQQHQLQQQQPRGLVRRAFTDHATPHHHQDQQQPYKDFKTPGLLRSSHAATHSVTGEQHSGVSSVIHEVMAGDRRLEEWACVSAAGGRAVPITQASTTAAAAAGSGTGVLFAPRHINRTVSDITHAARHHAGASGVPWVTGYGAAGVEVLPVLEGGSRKSSGCSMNTQAGGGQHRYLPGKQPGAASEGPTGLAMHASPQAAAAAAVAESRANSLQLPGWEIAAAGVGSGRGWQAEPLPSEVMQEAFTAAAAEAAAGEGWTDGQQWSTHSWAGEVPYPPHAAVAGAGSGSGGVYNSSGGSWVARHDTLPLQLPCLDGRDPYHAGYGRSVGVSGGQSQPAGGGHGISSGAGASYPTPTSGQHRDLYSGRQGGVGRRGTVWEYEEGGWGYSSSGAAPASLSLAAHIAGRPGWGLGHGGGSGAWLGGMEQGQAGRGMHEQPPSPLQQESGTPSQVATVDLACPQLLS